MPAHLGEVLDDGFVAHRADFAQAGDGAVQGFGRQVAQGEGLVVRQTRHAQLLVGGLQQVRRRGVRARFEAFERDHIGKARKQLGVDGRRGLAVQTAGR